MSYYTGRGDYYSGKGDFGSIFGSIVKGIGSVAGAAIPGVGGLISSGARLVGNAIAGTSSQQQTTTNSIGVALPFGPSIPQMSGGGGGGSCGSGACNSGYHLDKQTKTRCVRNRKTNYTNPRALARAAKRMDGFVGVARKALKTTNYKVVAKSFRANYRKPLKR